MKNKILYALLLLVIVAPINIFATYGLTVINTTPNVYVDGIQKQVYAYNINNNNYFKLRDIAYILDGTGKQFNIVWDAQKNSTHLIKNQPYMSKGNEGKIQLEGNPQVALPIRSLVLVDGKEIYHEAYNINNNYYYKLRDIGESLNLNIEWDEQSNAIYIMTKSEENLFREESIGVGFNAKATLSTQEQYFYVNKMFNTLKEQGVKTDKIWLRLNGGTVSQKVMPDDWSDDMISKWAQLQEIYGLKYMFVVNFNDTPQSQLIFYNRLKKGGIQFEGIELGNEQYLPKFAESKVDEYSEVTDRTKDMTPDKYIQMCNEYINEFQSEDVRFYVQFAPQKEDKVDYTKWNKRIAQAVNGKEFVSTYIGGSIHLYERDGYGSLDVKQINAIRSLMVESIPFAVTESGVVDKKGKITYNEFIEQEEYLISRVLEELKNGDLYFNQVLYTDYKKVGPEVVHPQYNGVTPKGEAVIELLKQYW